EALGAAAALHEATGDERFVEPYLAWWSYAEEHFVDDDGGSWWHELSPRHEVSRTVWDGKADLYHAVQATLVPRLPLAPALAPALAAGLLRPCPPTPTSAPPPSAPPPSSPHPSRQ